MPKVTVIVPAYNAEQYIEQCAKSLLAQTLDDIELIFINEGQNDLVRFLKNESKGVGEIIDIEADGKAAMVTVKAEAEDAEVFYAKLLPILADYDIGILY